MIFTVGHSTLSKEDFVSTLQKFGIEVLIDVRSMPGSRYVPHFNQEQMTNWLVKRGIDYVHIPDVGGRRRGPDTGVNTGWRNKSFRAYADYMQTKDFRRGLRMLQSFSDRNCALMCSEAVPWRCHRSLIADALSIRSIEVREIIGNKDRLHPLTKFARVEGRILTYPEYEE